MYSAPKHLLALTAFATGAIVVALQSGATFADAPGEALQAGSAQRIDLAERLASGKLKVVNREATALQGSPAGVHLSAKAGNGLAWIDGSDFAEGTIEVDIRGRDVPQQSFVGIAFHGKDDTTYEAVYLRPFNFRATDPVRHDHAVQVHRAAGLRLATPAQGVPGGVREPGQSVDRANRLGATPGSRQGGNDPGVRRPSGLAHADRPQARAAGSRPSGPLGGQHQRGRLREPPHHPDEVRDRRSRRRPRRCGAGEASAQDAKCAPRSSSSTRPAAGSIPRA